MKKDKKIGVSMLILGAFLLAATLMIKIPASSINIGEPGPRLFPMIGTLLILVSSIGLLVQKAEPAAPFMNREQTKRLVFLAGLFVLYAAALYLAGFMIATPIMLFVSMTMFAGKKKLPLWIKLVYCIAITAAIYFVFYKVLALGLPKGLIRKLW